MDEDRKLYQEFLNGNKTSFDKIKDKYIDRMIYFIYGFVRKIEIAEDLAQDVFVYILVNKNNYNFDYSLNTYLYMIAKFRAFNYLKSIKHKKEISLEEYQDLETNDEIIEIEDIIFNNIRDKNLKNAISKLNAKQSRIIYLSKIEDLKIKDISKILDISENDVKISIHRGIKKLKNIIGEEDDLYV